VLGFGGQTIKKSSVFIPDRIAHSAISNNRIAPSVRFITI